MRFKAPNDQNKIFWIMKEVKIKNRQPISYATWLDESKPRTVLIPEEIHLNLDVREHIQARESWLVALIQ